MVAMTDAVVDDAVDGEMSMDGDVDASWTQVL